MSEQNETNETSGMVKTFEEAKAAIEAWVTFYNTKRSHQALNYCSHTTTRGLTHEGALH
jgi:transposase InsO family protein